MEPVQGLNLNRRYISGLEPAMPVTRCVGLTTLPPPCAVCQEILGASIFWSPKGLPRHVKGLLDPGFAFA